jgi:hypothetical protein
MGQEAAASLHTAPTRRRSMTQGHGGSGGKRLQPRPRTWRPCARGRARGHAGPPRRGSGARVRVRGRELLQLGGDAWRGSGEGRVRELLQVPYQDRRRHAGAHHALRSFSMDAQEPITTAPGSRRPRRLLLLAARGEGADQGGGDGSSNVADRGAGETSGRFRRLLSSFGLGQRSRSTVLGSTSIRNGRSSRSTVLLISQPGRSRRIPSRRGHGRCSAFPPRRAPQSQRLRPPFPFLSLERRPPKV